MTTELEILRIDNRNLSIRIDELHMKIRTMQELLAGGDRYETLRAENERLERRLADYKRSHRKLVSSQDQMEIQIRELTTVPRRKRAVKGKKLTGLAFYQKKTGSLLYRNGKLLREIDMLRRRLALAEGKLKPVAIARRTGLRLQATLAMIEHAAINAATMRDIQ